jgi:hypothetical protein
MQSGATLRAWGGTPSVAWKLNEADFSFLHPIRKAILLIFLLSASITLQLIQAQN